MTQYIGMWNVKEAGATEVVEGTVYSNPDPDWLEWITKNSPGCLEVFTGKEAPHNRMETGTTIQNRGQEPRLPETFVDEDKEPESTIGQNSGDVQSLLPVDATPSAVTLADENGINLKLLQDKLGRRINKKDVQKAIKDAEEED
jgi:pyruvate/2-oxoglutarate dehydrogenase complex dihydrolipoamide acyltransferase (E2) component